MPLPIAALDDRRFTRLGRRMFRRASATSHKLDAWADPANRERQRMRIYDAWRMARSK